MAVLFAPFLRATDQSNAPIPGAFASFYATGTSTLQPVWSEFTLSIPLTNPVQADGNGVWPAIWLDDSLPPYKVVFQAPDVNNSSIPGAIIAGPNGTIDPYNAVFSGSALATLVFPELNPLSAAEVSAGVTPTNFLYPADPYIDPRRYGFSLTASPAVNSGAFQTAISVALQQSGGHILIPPGQYPFGSASVTFPSTWNHLTDSMTIRGCGMNVSQLMQSGAQANVLAFNGFSPTGAPTEAQLNLEDFAVVGTGLTNTANGILLNGIGVWTLTRVQAIFFTNGFNLTSALLGTFDNVMAVGCQIGVKARQNVTGSQCNAITVRGGRFNGCSLWAFDIGQSDGWTWTDRCDMEQNGSKTAFSFTGALTLGATSGTLSAPLTDPTGTYYVSFSDGELRPVTLTNGATTATWTTALAGAVAAAATYPTPNTGVIAIRASCVTATGVAQMNLRDIWKEANANPQILVENASGLTISMKSFVEYDSGVTFNVLGCTSLSIRDMAAASGLGSAWTLNATFGTLVNTECAVLNDAGISRPSYTSVQFATGTFTYGRGDHFTGTLTGCTTSPTASISLTYQGSQVTITFPSLTATSSSTACTITGLPSRYWPAVDTYGVLYTQDNGANTALPCLVAAATGVITIGVGHTFTGSGGKGVVGGTLQMSTT